MPAVADPSAHILPVEQMRLGDHAFAGHDDDETRWEILLAYAHLGLGRGEKVLFMADPAVPHGEVCERLRGFGHAAEAARARGQLVIGGIRSLLRPQRRFTAERQISRLWEETDTACREGYAGLRTVIDMAWVHDLGAPVEDVVHRETHAHALFSDRRYAEICTYDRRRFDQETLTAMRDGHPVALLGRLGDLEIVQSVHGIAIVGDADLATRERFAAGLRTALERAAGSSRLLVDLTRLCFLGAHCAALLLHQLSRSDGCARVEIRCAPAQARVLRRLGAAGIRRLVVMEVEVVRP